MAKTLKEIRNKIRMTMAEIDIDHAQLSKVESGQRKLSLGVAKKLSKAYNMTIEKIVEADTELRIRLGQQ